MALSMDEQRILDGMERKLADEDPKLASRLAAFGQPRLPVLLGSGRARAAFVLISLALAAMVALMVYSMRPFPASGQSRHTPSPHTSASASAPVRSAPGKPTPSV
ncbi:MAG TPA: DUF3040 domain-containing protein [Streptosporangiaceae bacterium]|jgi:hypothetical protein|nr:DUF3040 domain-containing protein [Streptosporangiaceae bacterium]